MVLDKCCCCLDLRIGAILIAIFQIISSLVTCVSLVTWNTVVIAILCVASGKCLLFGVIRPHQTATMVSLVLSMAGVLFYVVAVIMSIIVITSIDPQNPNFYEIASKDIAYGVSMISFAILNSYFCFCIYSFLGELKA